MFSCLNVVVQCYDYTVSVLNLKTGKAQMLEYKDNQLCSGSNKPFFEIKMAYRR